VKGSSAGIRDLRLEGAVYRSRLKWMRGYVVRSLARRRLGNFTGILHAPCTVTHTLVGIRARYGRAAVDVYVDAAGPPRRALSLRACDTTHDIIPQAGVCDVSGRMTLSYTCVECHAAHRDALRYLPAGAGARR
jgi:hypothetical protein